ncbi:MAG: triose-phosphate isomerase [Patescibacteria group bacterium]|nr:triose-phosphate isomerase [Patescibacteria group bacterium]
MYFVANWKMNPPTLAEAERLLKQVKAQLRIVRDGAEANIVICPPSIFFSKIAKSNNLIKFGVQNINWEERGSFTGETSILMAKDFGAEYCLVGHSERKIYFGENSLLANKKIKLCLEKGLTPIYCIGETLEEKQRGQTRKIIQEQLKVGLKDIGWMGMKHIIIAYEPIWAIGTQNGAGAANPDNVLEISILIRKILFDIYDQKTARKTIVLYGGSVTPKNVISYLQNNSSNGFLIGSASLNASDFVSIIKKSTIQKNVS